MGQKNDPGELSLVVRLPEGYEAERRYAVRFALGATLGLKYRVESHEGRNTEISLEGRGDDRRLSIAEGLFATPHDSWLTARSLPVAPLPRWHAAGDFPEANLIAPEVPILYGSPIRGEWLHASCEQIHLGVDVFGSALFMLARYEEFVVKERDSHGRFPATASLAWKESFLQRPIIDEYVELLWAALKRLWPELRRARRRPRVLVSHDVDWPLTPSRPFPSTLKAAAADLLRRRAARSAIKRIHAYFGRRSGDHSNDPFNTFDLLMDISEEHGLRSAFYFIADNTAGQIDGEYSLQDPWIRNLMCRIHDRGHEIGLHPTYGSFRNPAQVKNEFERLLAVTDALGIRQSEWGGRQHYLRWEAPITWRSWAEAGLAYDSTVGYADYAGFRCGTCREYPVFDLATRAELTLRERPLLAMEATLIEKEYMGLSHDAAYALASTLRNICQSLDGDFTFLWHNSRLLRLEDLELYKRVLG